MPPRNSQKSPSEYSLPIDCIVATHSEPLRVTVKVNEVPLKMEVDAGATNSIMGYSTLATTWPEEQISEVKATKAKFHTYTGEEIAVKGAVDVKVKYGDQEANLTVTIVDGDGPMLLGRDWLQHLRLDWAALNHITQDNCSELKPCYMLTLLCSLKD